MSLWRYCQVCGCIWCPVAHPRGICLCLSQDGEADRRERSERAGEASEEPLGDEDDSINK